MLTTYQQLKKGDQIKISFSSAYSGNQEKLFNVDRRSYSKKYKTEKLKLFCVDGPKCPFFLYLREGNLRFAWSDMACSFYTLEKV
mgnify:CR=1 FL=1